MKPLLTLLCFAGVIAVLLFAPVLYAKWYAPMFSNDSVASAFCFIIATGLVIAYLFYLDTLINKK